METHTTTVANNGLSYTGTLVGDVLIVSLESAIAHQQTVVLLDRDAKTAHVSAQTRSPNFDDLADTYEPAIASSVLQMAKDLHAEGIEFLRGPDVDPKLVKISPQPDGSMLLEEIVDGVTNSTATISADGLTVKESNPNETV